MLTKEFKCEILKNYNILNSQLFGLTQILQYSAKSLIDCKTEIELIEKKSKLMSLLTKIFLSVVSNLESETMEMELKAIIIKEMKKIVNSFEISTVDKKYIVNELDIVLEKQKIKESRLKETHNFNRDQQSQSDLEEITLSAQKVNKLFQEEVSNSVELQQVRIKSEILLSEGSDIVKYELSKNKINIIAKKTDQTNVKSLGNSQIAIYKQDGNKNRLLKRFRMYGNFRGNGEPDGFVNEK